MTITVSKTPTLTMGTLPSFVVTFAPADGQTGTATGLTVRVKRPDGSIYDDSAALTNLGANTWKYIGGQVLNMHGPWTWHLDTTGTLVGAFEVSEIVPYSPFVVEPLD